MVLTFPVLFLRHNTGTQIKVNGCQKAGVLVFKVTVAYKMGSLRAVPLKSYSGRVEVATLSISHPFHKTNNVSEAKYEVHVVRVQGTLPPLSPLYDRAYYDIHCRCST